MNAQELVKKNLIVKHLAGSHAYGTNIESSDTDYRGIFCANPINVLTPFFPIKEVEDSLEEDTKFYELWQFMKLVLECNPNIVESLWVDQSDIVHNTPVYEYLRAHRDQLLSSKAAFTFSGYAVAQLKRIKGHNKWINQPQSESPPTPKDYLTVVQYFGKDKNLKINLNQFLKNHRLIPYGNELFAVVEFNGHDLWDHLGKLNTTYEGDRSELPLPILLVKWNRDEFKVALEKHTQYWTWKNNRNEKRSALEEQFGYDTKHAMHLVRLLRMGEEILTTGQVIVRRPDAKELLSVRDGAWSYEKLVAYAEEKDTLIRDVLYKSTKLPKYPDVHLAADILMEAQKMVWSNGV